MVFYNKTNIVELIFRSKYTILKMLKIKYPSEKRVYYFQTLIHYDVA